MTLRRSTSHSPGAPARGNATAKTYDIASAMAGDRRRKHAVYIKSFIRRCGELVEGCPIVKKGLHPTYQLELGPYLQNPFVDCG